MRALLLLCLVACQSIVDPIEDTAVEDPEPPKKPRERLLERVETEFSEYAAWKQIPGWMGKQPSKVGIHGQKVAIYFNDVAMEDLTGERDGASSFKEVYGAGDHLAALHIMTFDDRFGWFYAVMSPEGVVDESGRLIGCVSCHETPSRSGFLAP